MTKNNDFDDDYIDLHDDTPITPGPTKDQLQKTALEQIEDEISKAKAAITRAVTLAEANDLSFSFSVAGGNFRETYRPGSGWDSDEWNSSSLNC